MKTASIEIGYNRRSWATFDIKDATPEELAILHENEQGDYSEEAFDLLRKMQDEGRLTWREEQADDAPQYFVEHAEPNIISVEGDEA